MGNIRINASTPVQVRKNWTTESLLSITMVLLLIIITYYIICYNYPYNISSDLLSITLGYLRYT